MGYSMTDIITVKPENYDGFTFRYDTMNKSMVFLYLDDLINKYGLGHAPTDVPEGRERYHVMLTSVKNNIPHIDEPFVSTFLDAFVYAEGIARSGFSGVMLRASRYAEAYMAHTTLLLMQLYSMNQGFVYTLADGREVPYAPGTKIIVPKDTL